MSEKPKGQPSVAQGQIAEEKLKGLKREVEELSTPEQRAERKIGNHLRDILTKGGYLTKIALDGTYKDVMEVQSEAEAERLVADLTKIFENSLKNHPELLEGIPASKTFHANFREMLICVDVPREFPMYYDVDVEVANGQVKAHATQMSVG